MHVNLLTAETRRRGLIRRSLFFWGRIWLSVIVIGSISLYWQYSILKNEWRRIDVRSKNIEPIRLARERVNELRQGIDAAKSQHQLISECLPNDSSLQLLSVLSNCIEGQSGNVHLLNLSLTQRSPSKQDKSKPPTQAASPDSALNLTGIAMDEHTVASLVQHLRESTVFTKIELRSMSQLKLSYGSACQFQIDCNFSGT